MQSFLFSIFLYSWMYCVYTIQNVKQIKVHQFPFIQHQFKSSAKINTNFLVYTVAGTGKIILHTSDQFQFIYQDAKYVIVYTKV